MMRAHMVRIVSLFLVLWVNPAVSLDEKKYPLLMPNVHPGRDELYLCTPVKIVPNRTFYIVGFEPNASMNTVHHMILFGCPDPGAADSYWDCGEMAVAGTNDGLKRANPCRDSSHIMYAWARDAKTLRLPDKVGFQIGKGTQVRYLVLQVHYAKKFPDEVNDNSGVNLMYTREPQTRLAGVVLLGTGGQIPPNSETHMETHCRITEDKTIYPFAYRTHTHSLGRVVAGYKVHPDDKKEEQWTLLGKRDPLTPQMFYPTFNTDPIFPGDILAARCTMISHRNGTTYVGATNKDEMCNFYLMYYVKEGTPLDMKYCISNGPPYYFWKTAKDLENIPDKDASTLDVQNVLE